jgi:hypothetical protein
VRWEREGERIRREDKEREKGERSGRWISKDPTTHTCDPCDSDFDHSEYCCVRTLPCMLLCHVFFEDTTMYILFAVCFVIHLSCNIVCHVFFH